MARGTLPLRPDERHLGSLDVDTEVPTPLGMSTVARLVPGDRVFGSDGLPVAVLEVSEELTDRACFEIGFSTGERLVGDDEQRLLTERRDLPRHASSPRRRRPAEIAEGVASLGPAAYAVRVAPAVQLSPRRLPVDPYLLGVWLGVGVAGMPAIRAADDELLRCLSEAGVRVFTSGIPDQHWIANPGGNPRGADLRSRLLALEVLDDQHLPMLYLRASVQQRRALLTGLLDACGDVSDGGEVIFRAQGVALATRVHQLVASLGFRPWFRRSGEGVEVEVGFVTAEQVFTRSSLQSQLAARRRLSADAHPRRLVTAVDPVESRPVRRVRVAADDGLFLVSRSFIPLPGATGPAA